MASEFNCRKCHVRDRCIDESSNPSSIKDMFRYAFEVRTDTLATWGHLQTNCLLAKARAANSEEMRGKALSRRINRLRAAKLKLPTAQTSGQKAVKRATNQLGPVVIGREEFNSEFNSRSTKADKPSYLEPVVRTGQKYLTGPLKPLPSMELEDSEGEREFYWLTIHTF